LRPKPELTPLNLSTVVIPLKLQKKRPPKWTALDRESV
jgi:hypothetical protein